MFHKENKVHPYSLEGGNCMICTRKIENPEHPLALKVYKKHNKKSKQTKNQPIQPLSKTDGNSAHY